MTKNYTPLDLITVRDHEGRLMRMLLGIFTVEALIVLAFQLWPKK